MNNPPAILSSNARSHTVFLSASPNTKTATTTTLVLHSPKPIFTPKHERTQFFFSSPQTRKPTKSAGIHVPEKAIASLLGAGLALSMLEPASAAELPLLGSSLQLSEPANALSLPTWAIHVSNVVEWITAMALVWRYGEKLGFESWKGISWGMVLVALQAALTVIGNATMCYAAYRMWKLSEEHSQNLSSVYISILLIPKCITFPVT